MRIEIALARAGITFQKDEPVELLNTKTGEINLAHAPDEIRFEIEQFNKQVVTPEFDRVVSRNGEARRYYPSPVLERRWFSPRPTPTRTLW